MSVEDTFTAIRKGLLEYLILKIVAADKVYAADILKRLSATDFATQEGTLYPLLSKMRRDGLLDYEWQESDAGPPRKYYELTARGRDPARGVERLLERPQRHHRATREVAMHKVISINLNGNAYQLDEAGYEALRLYLALAQEQLEDNPDRDEIIADLEQAIADKCQAYLGQHKTVVAAAEVERIVAEMGPVSSAPEEGGRPAGEATAGGARSEETPERAAKAAVSRPRRGHGRGRLHRHRCLFPDRRDGGPDRVRGRGTRHQGGRHHRLRGNDVRPPRGKHA